LKLLLAPRPLFLLDPEVTAGWELPL